MTKATLIKYPTRNPVWHLHDDNSFSTEASDLDANSNTDPWNRSLPKASKEHRSKDNDVTHWTFTTTVAGEAVSLTIWND